MSQTFSQCFEGCSYDKRTKRRHKGTATKEFSYDVSDNLCDRIHIEGNTTIIATTILFFLDQNKHLRNLFIIIDKTMSKSWETGNQVNRTLIRARAIKLLVYMTLMQEEQKAIN